MTRNRRQRGSAVLYAILLSPLIMLSLALVVEVGSIQLVKERLHSAADVATVDAAAQASTASVSGRIDPVLAEAATRQALYDNLAPLGQQVATGDISSIANNAQVYVITSVPAQDPLHPGQTLTAPAIESRMVVPVRSGLLSVAGLPNTLNVTIDSLATVSESGTT